MKYSVRSLIFLRLFLRIFVFTYPLFMTVMYNFWIFEKLPTIALWVYIAFMAILEIILGITGDRLPLKHLLTAYALIALPFEFPSVLLSGIWFTTFLVFLPWVIFWYGSLLLLVIFSITFRPSNEGVGGAN
ncbi:hypothetical protein [Thermococcus sp.]|uniref:hypothetical protein n=1 Tax=Thermococcus sp. TaxID=35749 RepID=UPI00262AB972|nr:hypothetical protein [Thermococcus sp.]